MIIDHQRSTIKRNDLTASCCWVERPLKLFFIFFNNWDDTLFIWVKNISPTITKSDHPQRLENWSLCDLDPKNLNFNYFYPIKTYTNPFRPRRTL
jgi:hypothetical protein